MYNAPKAWVSVSKGGTAWGNKRNYCYYYHYRCFDKSNLYSYLFSIFSKKKANFMTNGNDFITELRKSSSNVQVSNAQPAIAK